MITLSYPDATGPASVVYRLANSEAAGRLSLAIDLSEGVSSQSVAVEAAMVLATDAALPPFGLSLVASTDPNDYPPTPPEPEPPAPDPILEYYLDRAGPYASPANRVLARWAAYNHAAIFDEQRPEWTQAAVADLLAAPLSKNIKNALETYGWGIAVAYLSNATTADHYLATPEVLAAYLGAMAAEGALV